MAENTYTTLANRDSFKVTDMNKKLSFTLPEWMPSDREYETEEGLLEWAQEHEIVHALLQAGIRQMIIDLRAAARPSGKYQTFEQYEAQDRIDNFVCKPQGRPKSGGKKTTPEDAIFTGVKP